MRRRSRSSDSCEAVWHHGAQCALLSGGGERWHVSPATRVPGMAALLALVAGLVIGVDHRLGRLAGELQEHAAPGSALGRARSVSRHGGRRRWPRPAICRRRTSACRRGRRETWRRRWRICRSGWRPPIPHRRCRGATGCGAESGRCAACAAWRRVQRTPSGGCPVWKTLCTSVLWVHPDTGRGGRAGFSSVRWRAAREPHRACDRRAFRKLRLRRHAGGDRPARERAVAVRTCRSAG